MSVISSILHYAPMVLAPFILVVFSMISAYVLKFRLKGGGLGFDYAVFAIVVILCLTLGGAI